MIYEKNKGVGERMSKNKIIQTNKRHYTQIITKNTEENIEIIIYYLY